MQLDDLSRGFSFKSKSELNMSMGHNERSAKKVINSYSAQDLRDIIKILERKKKPQKYQKTLLKLEITVKFTAQKN